MLSELLSHIVSYQRSPHHRELRKTCNVMRRNSESRCRLKSPWWRLWKKSSKRHQTVWGKCSQRTRVGDCSPRRNVGRMYSVHFFEMRENKADQGGGGATQKSNCRRELQNSSFPLPTPGMDCSQSFRPTEKVDSPIQTSRLAEANSREHVRFCSNVLCSLRGVTTGVDRAHHDGCGAASPGRGTITGHRWYCHELEPHGKSRSTRSTTNSGLRLKNIPVCPRKLFWTPRRRRPGLRRSTCPPWTWRPRLSFTFRDTRRTSWWTLVMVCPLTKGCTLRHAILRLAGRDLSEYAMMNLIERGYSFAASTAREISRDVKENLGYIGLDYDTEIKSIAKFDKKENLRAPRQKHHLCRRRAFPLRWTIVRQVSLAKKPADSSPLYFQNVMKCDVDIRKDLYDNVVLSSGTTFCQGMVARMTNELTALAPSTMRSRWLLRFGGSILSTSSQTETPSLSRRKFS